MAATVPLDIALFRQLFPEFADDLLYPDALLQSRWDNEATAFVTDVNWGDLIDGRRAYAIQLMLAHVLRVNKLLTAAAGGGVTGVVVGATIDKVSVTLQAPSNAGEWTYWLNQTPYGQQFLAYLSMRAVGGFFVGGLPERAAFRKVGGVF